MDMKKVKELFNDPIYEIKQLGTIIDDQTQEIEYLKDKLEKCKMNDLTKLYSTDYPDQDVDVSFDDEYAIYKK